MVLRVCVCVYVVVRKAIYKRKQGIVYHVVLTGPFTTAQFIILFWPSWKMFSKKMMLRKRPYFLLDPEQSIMDNFKLCNVTKVLKTFFRESIVKRSFCKNYYIILNKK